MGLRSSSRRATRRHESVVVFGEDDGAANRVGEWLGLSPLGIAASSVRNQAARLPGGALVDVRVLTESSAPRAAWEQVEAVSAIFAGRTKMPAAAQERRHKVAFFLPSSRTVVVFGAAPRGLFSPHLLRELAFRARGLVFDGSALTDARGRLVLATSGAFDDRAMAPRELLVLPAPGASRDDLARKARALDKRDLRLASQVIALGDRDGPMNPHFRRLRSLPLGAAVDARRRLLEPYFAAPLGLHIAADGPLSEIQLRAVVKLAASVGGVVADAWGVYDDERRALMNLIGMFDRRARLASASDHRRGRPSNRFH